jgi:hypothetical protein
VPQPQFDGAWSHLLGWRVTHRSAACSAGTRVTQLLSLRHASGTLVFYAPPHGLCAILADMAQVFGAERRYS